MINLINTISDDGKRIIPAKATRLGEFIVSYSQRSWEIGRFNLVPNWVSRRIEESDNQYFALQKMRHETIG